MMSVMKEKAVAKVVPERKFWTLVWSRIRCICSPIFLVSK